jgi:hypothetical protein
MAFNHYAKIKAILSSQPEGWYIVRVPKPTKAKNFKGETKTFDHHYRIYNRDGEPIKYCKFQQIELLARILSVPVEALPAVENK